MYNNFLKKYGDKSKYFIRLCMKQTIERDRGETFQERTTLAVILWESGRGWSSLGFTMKYLPTLMDFSWISSDMHFIWPERSSNCIDSAVGENNATIKRQTKLLRRRSMAKLEREKGIERARWKVILIWVIWLG